MSKSRQRYAPEIGRQMAELVQAGRSPEELAREFEPTAQSMQRVLLEYDGCLNQAGFSRSRH